LLIGAFAYARISQGHDDTALAPHRLKLACDTVFVKGLKKQLAEAKTWPNSDYQVQELERELDTVRLYSQRCAKGVAR